MRNIFRGAWEYAYVCVYMMRCVELDYCEWLSVFDLCCCVPLDAGIPVWGL